MKTKSNLIALANDMSAFFPMFTGVGAHQQIFAANDANFDAQHLSEALSEYIVDYPDVDGLQALLNAAAPKIVVGGRSFTYRVHNEKEAFQAALGDEDIREVGGEFKKIRRTGTQSDGRTDNKGLTIVLDNDQGGADTRVQQQAVENIRGRLFRAELLRLLSILDANDTAASSSNWGPANATADPDMEVLAQVDLSGDARGMNANVALFGGGAMVKRKRSYSGRVTAGAFASLRSTTAEIASLISVEQVLESDYRYQTGASTKGKMIDNAVWIYYAKQGLMADDASNIKRFVTPTPSGDQRVYVQSELKRTLVTVEHYSRILCTSTLGIRQLPVTFS